MSPISSCRARGAAIVVLVALAVAGAVTVLSTPVAAAGTAPTLTSDQPDYVPGATVNLLGTHWQPGESVRVVVNDTVGQTWQHDTTVTADGGGNIVDAFALPNYFVSDYDASATGAQSGVATTTFTDNDTYDWSQCKNDNGGGSPIASGSTNDNTLDPCAWVNGNLASTNSIYTEGDVVPQRAIRTVAAAGNHWITLDHSFFQAGGSGAYAYDFFATPDATMNNLLAACNDVPTTGNFSGFDNTGCLTLLGAKSVLPIPDESVYPTGVSTYTYPHLADAEADAAADGVTRNLWISCGRVSAGAVVSDPCSGVTLAVVGHGDSNQSLLAPADQDQKVDSYTQLEVSFTTPNADMFVMIWIGGHLAKTSFWNGLSDGYQDEGAFHASGSSFHERLIADEGGSVGNRDNQLQTGGSDGGVIVEPGSLTIVKNDLTDSGTAFGFTADAPLSPSTFSLCDPAQPGCAASQSFASLPTGGYTIDEDAAAGWTLDSVHCTGATSTFAYTTTGATVALQPGDDVTCTFSNSAIKNSAIGSLTIAKTLDAGGSTFDTTTKFTIDYSCDNGGPSGTVELAGGGNQTITGIPVGSVCTVSEGTQPAAPTGYSWTVTITGSPTAAVTVGSTETVTVANALTRDYGSLSGTKWNDWDHDGVHDTVPAEPPIAGWQIRIFNAGSSAQTTTDAAGHYSFTLPTGVYTVCEKLQTNWVQSYPTGNAVCGSDGNGYTVTVVKNQTITGKDFGNWQQPFCTKAAPTAALDPATGIYPGNKGPDSVVRVDLGQSVQAAVDAAATASGDVNNDGYLIVAVSAKADRSYGGDATQAVVVSANYSKPFALIGCSVTLHDPNRSDGKPTIRIMSTASGAPTPISDAVGGKASIVLMDLHGADSEVAGVLAEGAGRYIWNSYGLKSAVGTKIVGDGNTVHNGQGSSNTGAGVMVVGSSNYLTDTSAMGNGGNGFEVSGNSNQLLKLNAGDKATPNKGDGVHVVGNSNVLSEITAFANGGDGFDVAGATNTLSTNTGGDGGKGNGQSGFRVAGAGNLAQANRANANGGDGFTITQGTAASPNRLKSNESNTGTSGSTLENKGAEYRLTNSVKNDSGGNKADSIGIPKTTAPTKCTAFPGTNATVAFGSANACE